MCVRLAARLLAPAVQPTVHDSHHQHLFQFLVDRVHHLPAQVPTVLLRRIGIVGQRLLRYDTAAHQPATTLFSFSQLNISGGLITFG